MIHNWLCEDKVSGHLFLRWAGSNHQAGEWNISWPRWLFPILPPNTCPAQKWMQWDIQGVTPALLCRKVMGALQSSTEQLRVGGTKVKARVEVCAASLWGPVNLQGDLFLFMPLCICLGVPKELYPSDTSARKSLSPIGRKEWLERLRNTWCQQELALRITKDQSNKDCHYTPKIWNSHPNPSW